MKGQMVMSCRFFLLPPYFFDKERQAYITMCVCVCVFVAFNVDFLMNGLTKFLSS
jgi:hypothetical protein